jgi:TPP-dependent 2-oxoacid decarboxylase
MKLVRPLSLSLALFAVGAPSWAAQQDQHKAHHPAGSASAAASTSMPGKTTPEMARMANQTKAMQEMHDKMMAAKTAEERNALMAEHMKTMQEGMGMMKGMGGMTGPKSPPTNMTERQTMMEQRMDMMQTMMEMMVDRLPQTPAKP